MAGGFPLSSPEGELVTVITREQVQEWYASRRDEQVRAAAAAGQENQRVAGHTRCRARLHSEVPALQKDDQFVLERYDGTARHDALEKYIFGRSAVERIVKDGNKDKPLAELLRLYPSRKSAPAAAKK